MPAAGRLPRGRHGLSRDEVAAAQRRRLLRATAAAMAELGYARTPVAEILRRAGVSRETFYQQFSSKEDCFAATFEAAVGVLLGRMASAAARRGPGDAPIDRFSRALRAYLDALAAEPELARVFLIEVYAAGPAAIERRAADQARFADAVAEVLGARTGARRFACEVLVAAIASLVTMRIAAGDLDGLRALHRPLVGHARELLAAPAG
ncbi:MAG: TetR/AcrR family transcriptional regulator [Solirubrobacterales bacterium]|nr:TetR/AcrR family transcriptional regulator [Solirubrobacterales bacterium]